ncbi:MAG: ParB-like protein [Synechococcus lacustris]|jgi:hypothetical protein
MTLELPPYQPLPAPPSSSRELLELPIASLHPTQMCVGLAEVLNRHKDFSAENPEDRSRYLKGRPVPLVRSGAGELWMVDRHHRLRGLLEVQPGASAWGYVVLELATDDPAVVLANLRERGWLYLYNGRGQGPLEPQALPANLSGLEDDPFRSLVWKLKQEGVIASAPLIPFHEFRWGAWLRRRELPPFSSLELEAALPTARAHARSSDASHLAGWKG